MDTADNMKRTLKDYILKEFLPGEKPEQLTESTPLITGGILDSLATLKLVAFIEEQYKIELQAHEADVEHLNKISDIVSLVQKKKSK
jgi:acyl carrier protein